MAAFPIHGIYRVLGIICTKGSFGRICVPVLGLRMAQFGKTRAVVRSVDGGKSHVASSSKPAIEQFDRRIGKYNSFVRYTMSALHDLGRLGRYTTAFVKFES